MKTILTERANALKQEAIMERNNRKVYVGKVCSSKEDKTIKEEIVTYRKHP